MKCFKCGPTTHLQDGCNTPGAEAAFYAKGKGKKRKYNTYLAGAAAFLTGEPAAENTGMGAPSSGPDGNN